MNLYGQDMDESVTPLESGPGVDGGPGQDERDFIGRRRCCRARRAPRMLGLVLLDKGVMRSHQTVRCAHGDGEITSGSFAPTLGCSIALARVPAGRRPRRAVEVEVREKWLAAKVVKPPFVRHGKSLMQA